MAASILIVDDDAVQRRLVENMVQKAGYEAVVVDSGDAAIALLAAPLSAQEKAAGREEFIYKKTKEGDLKMYVHYPPDWKAADKRPAMVFFFGGGTCTVSTCVRSSMSSTSSGVSRIATRSSSSSQWLSSASWLAGSVSPGAATMATAAAPRHRHIASRSPWRYPLSRTD